MTQQTANNQQKPSQEALTRTALQDRSNELSLKQSGFGNALKKLFGMRKRVEAASLADTLSKIDSFTQSVETMTNAPFKSGVADLTKAMEKYQQPFKDSVAASTKELRKTVDEVLVSLAGTSVDDFRKMAPDEKKKLILQLSPEDQVKLKDALSQTKRQVNASLNHMRENNKVIEEVLSQNPSPEVIKRLADNMTVPTPPKEPFERKEALKKLTEQAKLEIKGEAIELKSERLLANLQKMKDILNMPAPGSSPSTSCIQASAPSKTVVIPASLAQTLEQMVETKTVQEKKALEDALNTYKNNRNSQTMEGVANAEEALRKKSKEAHKILLLVADELQNVAPTYTPASGRHSNGLVPKDNALDETVKELKQKGVDPAVANELFEAGNRLTGVYSKHIQSMLLESPETVTSEEIAGTLESLQKRRKQLLEVEEADVDKVSQKFMQPTSVHRKKIEAELEALHEQVKAARSGSQNKGAEDEQLSLD